MIRNEGVEQGVRLSERGRGEARQPLVLEGTEAALDHRFFVRAAWRAHDGFDLQGMEQAHERCREAVARPTTLQTWVTVEAQPFGQAVRGEQADDGLERTFSSVAA